jgi:hypothetical protein
MEAERHLMSASNRGKIIVDLVSRRGPGSGRTVVAEGAEIIGDGQIEIIRNLRCHSRAELLPRRCSGRTLAHDDAALEADVE